MISFSSDVFENMFESDMEEARQRMVVIEDIKAKTIEKLLEFMGSNGCFLIKIKYTLSKQVSSRHNKTYIFTTKSC